MIACTIATAEPTLIQREAKQALEMNIKMKDYRGSIFAQAHLDKIDYRPILRRAIDRDSEALVSLFPMEFMGEGAETHCSNLLHLMRLWGDDAFSVLLTKQAKEIRDLVVSSIDYAWADPEWNVYTKTRAASQNNVRRDSKKQNKSEQATPRKLSD